MRTISYIAVHCTASPQSWGVKELQKVFEQRGFLRPGYHYVITADGEVHPMQPEGLISNGVKGFNKETINVAYVGGIDAKGRGIDNRTDAQKISLRKLLSELHTRYPHAKIQGHRDFSPDTNHNGVVDPWERIKECPCFDAIPEYADL
nr:MAG TPA: endodeoxyribonuclease I [Caudoviricetes sp.]